ncbi:acyltransferase family protein [Stutzerimonas nitrititolerans]|uniref:acyltransferase family protein n=1 Tax=Stutzerimonas nitrititolerans TaxID=2482751 RepID=UPI002896DF5F|nr:acyltransferase [Stutzerimonas nitrititolerans]
MIKNEKRALPPASLPAADGIRGLACLTVLLMHGISFCWPDAFPLLRGGGKYGVWLFFVLSAFLLTLRLQQRGFALPSMTDYALGRCLRILPLYALACVLYYAVGHGIQTREQLIDALTFQQGFIHLWTIPVEFKFYLLLPPLAWAGLQLQQRFGNGSLLLGALALLVAQQVLWPYWLTPESSAATRWYIPSFLFGLLAALWLPAVRRLPRRRLATLCALFTLAVLCVALPGARLWLFGTSLSGDLLDKHLYLSLLWALFIVLLVDGDGVAGRWLCTRHMAFLGSISYSAYLFHLLIMLPIAARWPQQPAALVAAIGLSIAAGALGYYLAERPLERLRRHCTTHLFSPARNGLQKPVK